jgi:quinoprotein glucose dehydrogenase
MKSCGLSTRRQKRLGVFLLPTAGYATPATYEVNGKQYVIITTGGVKGGSKPGDTVVAFALPD